MSSVLEYRKVEPGDCEALSQLFAKLWSWQHPASCWHHKFFENPAGEPVIHVAADKATGQIVGCVGGIPLRYRLCGEEVLAWTIVDAGVLPEHRKRGTFWKMYKMGEEECYRRSVAFCQAVGSTEAELIALRMMKFKALCPRPVFVRPVTPRVLLPKSLRSRGLRWSGIHIPDKVAARHCRVASQNLCDRHGFSIQPVADIDERFNALWKQVQDQWQVALVRDREFLVWRFTQNPVREYRVWTATAGDDLLGYCVTAMLRRDGVSRGRIVDFLAAPDAAPVTEALLLHATGALAGEGADIVLGWFLPHGWWQRPLAGVGMKLRPAKERQIIVRPVCAEQHADVLSDPRCWYYTGADTDQF